MRGRGSVRGEWVVVRGTARLAAARRTACGTAPRAVLRTAAKRGRCDAPLTSRPGWTLVEVAVVLAVMGVLIAVGIPTFGRAVEQSRADLAAANLRAVWSAERLYWLENNTYTTDLSALQALGLLDPTVVTAATVYVYQVPSADGPR